MSHVTADQISAALATKKLVWSRAWGRMGRIVAVRGNCVELRPGAKGKGRLAITWFHKGDEVELIELTDRFEVWNTPVLKAYQP